MSFLLFFVLLSCLYVVPIFAISPKVIDDGLALEQVIGGFKFPTSMEFLGEDDFIVGEKGTGKIFRVINGTKMPVPLLDANVSYGDEPPAGLFSMAATTLENGTVFVYVSMLESGVPGTDNDDFKDKIKPKGNILYRYELEDNKLVNPKILSNQEFIWNNHFGGALRIGPDNKLYYMIGDQVISTTQAVNLKTAPPPDGQSGILRMNLDGSPVAPGILGSASPTNLYYAYGIRNGFGMDFDPLTGNLWDTENGPNFGDEINLVLPGFNSGWRVMQGSSSHFDFKNYTGYNDRNF